MVTFNDTSTLQGLFQHTKFLTGADNLSLANFTRLANFAMDDYSSIVMSCDGKWKFDDTTSLTTPTGYTQVVSGQNAYTLDTNFLKIERVEIKVSGVWRVVSPIDQTEYKDVSLSTAFATPGTPQNYDYDGQQIMLYPAPNWSDSGLNTTIANNSLRVFHSRPVSYFDVDDTTTIIGIPRVHHQYIALKAAKPLMIKNTDSALIALERELVAWEGLEVQGRLSGGKIREYFSNRDENTVRRIKPKLNTTFSRRTFNKRA